MALITATDLRLAFRTLQTRPGLSAVIIATLALGIGATTAMFSVLNAALLRPLPFAEPDRLVVMQGVFGPERSIRGASLPEVRDWRALNHTMTDVSVFDQVSLNLQTETGAERVVAERVNAGYFTLLGVSAARGRTFTPEEDSLPDAHPVAVVSHSFWRNRFGSDPALIGKTITLNGRALTVVGIMPEGFAGLSFQGEIWFTVASISVDSPVSLLASRSNRLGSGGRPAPGWSRVRRCPARPHRRRGAARRAIPGDEPGAERRSPVTSGLRPRKHQSALRGAVSGRPVGAADRLCQRDEPPAGAGNLPGNGRSPCGLPLARAARSWCAS